jgi:excisionase family DNA binding protein
VEEARVYTVREFGKLMKISEAMAYRLVREGRVPSIRIGDRYLLSSKTINSILSGELQIKTGTADMA